MAVVTPDGIVGKVIARLSHGIGGAAGHRPGFRRRRDLAEERRCAAPSKGRAHPPAKWITCRIEEKVEPGEWFYTSGDDRIFPRGFPVGSGQGGARRAAVQGDPGGAERAAARVGRRPDPARDGAPGDSGGTAADQPVYIAPAPPQPVRPRRRILPPPHRRTAGQPNAAAAPPNAEPTRLRRVRKPTRFARSTKRPAIRRSTCSARERPAPSRRTSLKWVPPAPPAQKGAATQAAPVGQGAPAGQAGAAKQVAPNPAGAKTAAPAVGPAGNTKTGDAAKPPAAYPRGAPRRRPSSPLQATPDPARS